MLHIRVSPRVSTVLVRTKGCERRLVEGGAVGHLKSQHALNRPPFFEHYHRLLSLDLGPLRVLAVSLLLATGLYMSSSSAMSTPSVDGVAPEFGSWGYRLCQPLNFTSLYAAECEKWLEGVWAGNSVGCLNQANPFPWLEESQLEEKARAFYGEPSSTFHGWLAEGETIPSYYGCWSGPPGYKYGVESSNAVLITTSGASGGHSFGGRRDRDVFCPVNHAWNASASRCVLQGYNPYKNNDYCKAGNNGTNPIHGALGTKLQRVTDIAGPGPFPLRFERFYTSANHWEPTAMGTHWRHNYARRIGLVETRTGFATATAFRPNGDRYYFNLDNGSWVSDPDVTDRLVRLTDDNGDPSGWRYTNKDDVTEEYDVNGLLLSLTNRVGQRQLLEYDSDFRLVKVSDDFGHSLNFMYDPIGRLVAITGSFGIYSYTYDTAENLISVGYPEFNHRIYLYEDSRFPHALTGIIDERGFRVATWQYDDQGRAISSLHAAGNDGVSLTFSRVGHDLTTATDQQGKTTTFHFILLHGVYKVSHEVRHATASAPEASRDYGYDANGFLSSKTDWNGNLTTYVRDARGLELSRTEAAGSPAARTITTEWHPDYRLPLRITEPGRVTEYTYSDGRLTSVKVKSSQ